MAKQYARTFGQDLMKGEHIVGGNRAAGVLFENNPSGADPAFYAKKRAKEKELGRQISTAEFIEQYYQLPEGSTIAATGTSVFDPVLCELAYTWFSPPGGVVLDPFAGGSVRGIVAAKLGRRYVGVDLRAEQVEANVLQWEQIRTGRGAEIEPAENLCDETPLERRGAYWIKRDDSYAIGGGRGGKVRTCWALAQGADGLVTAGSRSSPQANIVAQIAKRLGIPCRLHIPTGELSPELELAREAGAEIVQHKAGYNNVIIARAREDAAARGWREIPFGMECPEAVELTAAQLPTIPAGVKRIVVPVGSGMSLAGILTGLERAGLRGKVAVLGVRVGADPTKRLNKYAPAGWEEMVELVDSGLSYDQAAPVTNLEGIELDPIYEAKCLPFLAEGDLFWIVGRRASAGQAMAPEGDATWHCGDSQEVARICAGVEADFLFSCPPYADLEVYSDDPRDLSTMEYQDFKAAYRAIIRESCALLRDNRFACFVVGDVRDKNGLYYNFVSDTIQAFLDAGLRLYNEAILVTTVGSLPVRVGKQFVSGRKLGKTHQNVLVFVKGNWREATKACGEIKPYLGEEAMTYEVEFAQE